MNTPETLSPEAAEVWREVLKQFEIEDRPGLLLLQTALEAMDRMREAQKLIDDMGLLLRDRFNQPALNPAVTAEKAARAQMLQALRQLDLAIELPAAKPGRRDSGGSYHR